MSLPLPIKTRVAFVVWAASLISLPILLAITFSSPELGTLRWGLVLPSLLGLVFPLLWPLCPHCRAGIIWPKRDWAVYRTSLSLQSSRREDVAWLWPPRYCPTCHQELDGPLRSKEEFRAHIEAASAARRTDLAARSLSSLREHPDPRIRRDDGAA